MASPDVRCSAGTPTTVLHNRFSQSADMLHSSLDDLVLFAFAFAAGFGTGQHVDRSVEEVTALVAALWDASDTDAAARLM